MLDIICTQNEKIRVFLFFELYKTVLNISKSETFSFCSFENNAHHIVFGHIPFRMTDVPHDQLHGVGQTFQGGTVCAGWQDLGPVEHNVQSLTE